MIKYPVAQIFMSPQGEGQFSGHLMKFIRLAGCNVGRYTRVESSKELTELRILHPLHSVCTSALGTEFLCDTNYHGVAKLTADEIMTYPKPLNAKGTFSDKFPQVCLTGGEPFMYDLRELVEHILAYGCDVHLETSGTKVIPSFIEDYPTWVTGSPKKGFIPENRSMVDEWKFVVGVDIDADAVIKQIFEITGDSNKPVYIQPINGVATLEPRSVESVLKLQRMEPRFIISQQLHKVLGTE